MRKGTTAALILAGAALILDSRYAAQAVQDSLKLCAGTLIPNIFPLFVISAMLVPGLLGFRFPLLSRLSGFPSGSEGIWLLGVCGGFPVGAACICQSVLNGSLSRTDGKRMLGLCSLCGPAFLFGVLPHFLPMHEVIAIIVLQMETSLLLACLWPGESGGLLSAAAPTVSMPEAVGRAVDSMLCVCAWVTLASVASAFLRRWFFPLIPAGLGAVLIGLLELTNGIFALPEKNQFLLCTLFVCFGGISVLLQIGGLAGAAGLGMKTCILQKSFHAALGAAAAAAYLHMGAISFLFIPAFLFIKMALEIPGSIVYNGRERKGSTCCFVKKWTAPASTAGSARKWTRI